MSERIAPTRTPEFEARLKKRYASERRFRALGLGAIVFSVAVLVFLLGTMTFNGIGGFQRVEMEVPIDFTEAGIAADPAAMEQPGALASLEAQGLRDVVQYFAEEELGEAAAEELGAQAWRDVATAIIADPAVLQRSESFWLPASANLASGYEGEGSPEMQALAAGLYEEGRLAKNFDPGFLGRSDATNPQQVGIWGALKGSLLTMVVTLLLAFPIGVLAALYLEEYAPKNRWTDLIELSINNLAAVPSIIFGLLGLAVFLTLFPNLRSAPLIGGMTLALMTMPVIVIAGRNAIKAVPPSIRDGALAIGASPVQVVFHHVLPLALPGILTGTIIGMARALGETAPLLMIGMRAFVATPPDGFTSPATVLPMQIFLWSDEIDRGFVERTSAAIIVLLLFLLVMNGLAIYLRNKFEKTW
ncbi:MAG TPA: phosphate ABC transporter permease PtsA [Erythrobacter sp.]|jgi:phosphate transport system permease protein|uniref:phosphate ABC transporter permease PstA n=1 Tax=Qipengyuania sp. GPGPB31 TaxID=3023518 RepID=UPI000C4D44E9|nr:phosphate ABC transporter, permease protein PstA [Sphingomonadaceae bacterium]MDP7324663.1 phosphate ABC transporter permease PstA [Qipengyuania citrea]HAW36494.1 phosphate ABC transporter permease PtsA [Erythrobacter sp.]HBQ91964.1 phosphate ABC transporter permease PtsA [Erythrobacter sp.]HCC27691.1 phosphate ABC transporter permease PtsA [Erythrobacter sp.]|tara:strand:+ start:539 stop:1789 length:1251 start_codon:yes stop_codon:yes gene_type:complete